MALLKVLLFLAFSSVGIGGPLVASDPDHFSPATGLIKRSTPRYPQNMNVDEVNPLYKMTSKRLGCITCRYSCPEKQTLDSNGHCSAYLPGTPTSAGCLEYCEVRLNDLRARDDSDSEMTIGVVAWSLATSATVALATRVIWSWQECRSRLLFAGLISKKIKYFSLSNCCRGNTSYMVLAGMLL